MVEAKKKPIATKTIDYTRIPIEKNNIEMYYILSGILKESKARHKSVESVLTEYILKYADKVIDRI